MTNTPVPTTTPTPTSTNTPVPTATPTPLAEDPTGWILRSDDPDPVSGEVFTTIGLNKNLDDEHKAEIVVRCISGRDNPLLQVAVFTTIESVIRQRYSLVQHRFDEDEPSTVNWYYAHYTEGTVKTGLFYSPQSEHSNDDSREFIQRLKTANHFAVRFASSLNERRTILWEDVMGFEEGYKPYRRCVWRTCNR